MAVGVMQRLEDLNTVLGQTNDHRHRVLVAGKLSISLRQHFVNYDQKNAILPIMNSTHMKAKIIF